MVTRLLPLNKIGFIMNLSKFTFKTNIEPNKNVSVNNLRYVCKYTYIYNTITKITALCFHLLTLKHSEDYDLMESMLKSKHLHD